MKNIKFLLAALMLMAAPLFSKAQIVIGGALSLTINYVDVGYGALTCSATSQGPGHSYPFTLTNGTSHTYTSNDASWWMLDLITTSGQAAYGISIPTIEAGANGSVTYYDYVPKSPSGTAPVFSITKNSPYNYTVRTWLIPQ